MKSNSSEWRNRCRPIVAKVLDETGRSNTPALRKKLREAYPFARRKGWAYQCWLNEIKAQLGESLAGRRKGPKPEAPGQLSLFDLPVRQGGS